MRRSSRTCFSGNKGSGQNMKQSTAARGGGSRASSASVPAPPLLPSGRSSFGRLCPPTKHQKRATERARANRAQSRAEKRLDAVRSVRCTFCRCFRLTLQSSSYRTVYGRCKSFLRGKSCGLVCHRKQNSCDFTPLLRYRSSVAASKDTIFYRTATVK